MSKLLGNILGFLPRKVTYAAAILAIDAARAWTNARYPNLVLPTSQEIWLLGVSLIGAHTITDVVAILKDAAKDTLKRQVK